MKGKRLTTLQENDELTREGGDGGSQPAQQHRREIHWDCGRTEERTDYSLEGKNGGWYLFRNPNMNHKEDDREVPNT